MIREEKKEGRRRAIVHAAETLIRETGSTNFSMVELGQRAGLSTATTYNLIGSKATVLYVLLNRCMDRVDTGGLLPRGKKDAFEHVFQAADIAVDIYTSDPNFYRPLMRFLLGVPDPVHRPAFMKRAYRYWRVVVQALVETDCVRDGLEANDLARDFQVFFAGAIDFWVHDELDGPQFQAQIRHGMALRLLALGVESANDRLLRKIKAARKIMDEVLNPGEESIVEDEPTSTK